ncbi:metal-dependent hydrolase family protein [Lacinutrix jangbogonensis]|uniref:metal-dependent hydrolase family protein n=1 Tax=Lacinutrix jangbogonensis TaxID=1469557 RepID=UPI00053E2486|nr:amidohydrolase family protein [Lacinutrix jangbogonensis]
MKLFKTILFFTFILTTLFSNLYAQNITIIHAGKLLAVPGKGVETEKTIIIENGLISSVKDGFLNPEQLGYAQDSVNLIDLSKKFVMPGLIDMHTHITGERNPNRNPHEWLTLNDEDFALEAIPYLKITLQSGFTTVRNLGAKYTNINALKRAIAKGIISGPRIIASTGAVSATGGHGDFHGYRSEVLNALEKDVAICNGADDCRRAVRALVKQGADVIKVTATGGVLSNTSAGVGQQLTDDELLAIVETAHSLGRKVAAHAHAADGINAALRAGVDSIEHGSYLDDESVMLFKKNDAYLVPTLLAGVYLGEESKINDQIPPFIVKKIEQVIPVVEASFRRAVKGNVNIAFGTDSGVSKHGTNAREFELMVKYGMSPEASIKTATINAATLLGMFDEIGSIEKGKIADLIAVDGDPLTNISILKNVQFVMKSGEVFKD